MASIELLRERLHALSGVPLPEADVLRLLIEVLRSGGGVTLELDELRMKLIRREGRFLLKEDPRRSSSLPPRTRKPSGGES